ncbi:MAG: DUF4405 domain-containing protein [Treponema sp.]|nr:DUF4405 domain-containing protein [Treponema sp.]
MASQEWDNGTMNSALAVRIIIDLCMTILLLCAYAYRIIGDIAHEWIGVFVFVLFIAHNVINYRWYKNIGKGVYTARRVIMATVNALLALTMATLVITGFLQSRIVLSFLNLPGDMVLRQIHTTTAYWGLPLIGVHIGLHWGIFTNFINKNNFIIIAVRILACLFAAFGVWSFFDRDMFAKLFLGFSFDYWPPARPSILFFAETLSVMGLFIFAAYYGMKIKDTIGGSL